MLYIDLGKFAHHVIDLYKGNKIAEFPAVFDVIEKLHIEGDDYVREAATIGLLEGIQNIASHAEYGVNADEFIQYLKPETAKWWQQLNSFWDGKIPYVGATIKRV